MKTRIVPVLLFAAIVALSARGQEADSATKADSATEAVAAETDSHTLAVEEFFEVMKMKQTTDQTVDQMLAIQIQQQPQLASFQDVMATFLRKHVSYEALKEDMVKLYKSAFTQEEIEAMTEFYRTPVGQKAVSKLPSLAAAGAQLGLQRVQANMGELQQAIARRQTELQNQ